jgi:hypothetical protein
MSTPALGRIKSFLSAVAQEQCAAGPEGEMLRHAPVAHQPSLGQRSGLVGREKGCREEAHVVRALLEYALEKATEKRRDLRVFAQGELAPPPPARRDLDQLQV